jgi:hypothetical protein
LFSALNQSGSTRGRESVRPMVQGGRNTEASHFIKQGSALQPEPRGCSPRTTELPIGALTSSEDFFTNFVLKRRIRSLVLGRCRFASFRAVPVQTRRPWKGSRRAPRSFATLEYSLATNDQGWIAWFPQGWSRQSCPWKWRTPNLPARCVENSLSRPRSGETISATAQVRSAKRN